MLRQALTVFAHLICVVAIGTAAISYAGVGPDGKEVSSRADEKAPTPSEAVKRFTVNVTEKAKAGQLDPFIGKREKIRKIIEILSKRGVKTLILIGEAGSGKTALVEQAAGQLEGKTVYSLDIQALIGGATYRGQFEERISALLAWFKANPEAILFIDEFKAVVEPGKEDLRNALLPPLARGEISAIMATTDSEFREFVEPDAALTSRGDIERLEPPTEKEMVDMLRSRKAGFEKHHGIGISDAALKKAAKLVVRFYPSDKRNRKVLGIVDNAMAREAISRRLGNYDRLALENEKESIELRIQSLQSDLPRHPGDANLFAEIEQAKNELAVVIEKLQEESVRETIEKKQLELSQREQEAKQHEKAGNLQAMSALRFGVIPALEQQIRDLKAEPLPHSGDITEAHIAKYVATEVGVRPSVVAANELERLERIAEDARNRVLFQEGPIAQVISQLKVRAANVEEPRPIFLVWDGPNGVGKSELARVISMLETGKLPLLIEANKYSGQENAWQLFGSGKGFKDSAEGGDLEPLRNNPSRVVLIDEGNLGGAAFWKLLYQLSSEGVVNDMRGRPIDGRNAIFIITANFTQNYATYKDIWTNAQIEAFYAMPVGSLDGLSGAERDAKVLDHAMKLQGVPPGMRDRIAGKIVFNAFDMPKAIAVARLQLALQRTYIYQEHGVIVEFGEGVAEAVAKAGFDLEFNARPLRRAQSDNISTLLADLSAGWRRGDTVTVTFEPNTDGKGGRLVGALKSKSPMQKVLMQEVLFKAQVDPHAAAARAAGEAGRPQSPTDTKNIIERAARKARGKK